MTAVKRIQRPGLHGMKANVCETCKGCMKPDTHPTCIACDCKPEPKPVDNVTPGEKCDTCAECPCPVDTAPCDACELESVKVEPKPEPTAADLNDELCDAMGVVMDLEARIAGREHVVRIAQIQLAELHPKLKEAKGKAQLLSAALAKRLGS